MKALEDLLFTLFENTYFWWRDKRNRKETFLWPHEHLKWLEKAIREKRII